MTKKRNTLKASIKVNLRDTPYPKSTKGSFAHGKKGRKGSKSTKIGF